MTGRRARQLYRDDMDRRFHGLAQFFSCYLHQNWPDFHDTPQQAVENAISDYPIALRRQIRGELQAVLAEFKQDKELREVLNWGLGVSVHFNKAEEARSFAEDVNRTLMQSIDSA